MDSNIEHLLEEAERFMKMGKMQESIQLLQQAADRGSVCACERLAEGAFMMPQGGFPEDMAYTWAKKAVEMGNAVRAYTVLGLCYMEGKGVMKDAEVAKEYFERGFEAGDMKAPRYLGMIYELGIVANKDLGRAFNYYSKAAVMGDITAQYHLGRFYENGIFVEPDMNRAVAWYIKSAARGDIACAPAMGALDRLGVTGR